MDGSGDQGEAAVVAMPPVPAETILIPSPPARRKPGRPRKPVLPPGSPPPPKEKTRRPGPVLTVKVKREVEQFRPYIGDDPRRLLYIERITALRHFIERELRVALEPDRIAVVKQVAELARMALRDWAAGVRLDLEDMSEAKSLTTASAILAYIDKFNQIIEKAEQGLERDAPDEYQKLAKALETRSKDAK